MTTGHPPGPEGEREMLTFLEDYSRKHHLEKARPQDVESKALTALCRVLLVSNAAMHLE
jgi:ubiquinone biosynthesis protein COQ9